MSTSFAVPAPRSAVLLRRRIATYFVGGAEQIPALVHALDGRPVHELSVDIKDGVRESSMVCAVLLAAEETEPLLDRLRGLPSVVSAELA
ncbi:hypothetical protein [Amycolatopsis australiensis]|uniref:ACT domain-containing protein n=1 Tax=Amycolatopsis australiensis TaxID=546364 RepID=A0A1K1RF42_9PSEU|nr:hypothetical protein [Amycolatopsis australiensis]SFW70302.1 hypothetical protein SAMN04489730_3092 [Amycolatopsis australiensis]